MNQAWSDFQVLDAAPNAADYQELPDANWGVLFAWTAGPKWVVAVPTSRGSVADDYLDETLDTVGIPRRPRGYDWFIRLTSSQSQQFNERVGERVEPVEEPRAPGGGQEYLIHCLRIMTVAVPEELDRAVREK